MYRSLEEIIQKTNELNLPIWKVIQLNDCKATSITEQESYKKMLYLYNTMKETDRNYNPELRTPSNLIGGEAKLIHERYEQGKMISGTFISTVIEKALRTPASNACMRRVVAAPTAGSCGVIPAVLITYQETHQCSDEKMVEALYVASGIGAVIGHKACLSGAQGGCQAEIGSASSMASGALAYLEGADPTTIMHASALAMKGLLGLACDPVSGLVEVPCVKRNVIGAVNAVTSCDMACAGIRSMIPPDEVIEAMNQIGNHMPSDIRETGIGGLAGTKTAKRITQELIKEKKL